MVSRGSAIVGKSNIFGRMMTSSKQATRSFDVGDGGSFLIDSDDDSSEDEAGGGAGSGGGVKGLIERFEEQAGGGGGGGMASGRRDVAGRRSSWLASMGVKPKTPQQWGGREGGGGGGEGKGSAEVEMMGTSKTDIHI